MNQEVIPIPDDIPVPELFQDLTPRNQAFILALLRTGGDIARSFWIAFEPKTARPESKAARRALQEDFYAQGLLVWQDKQVKAVYRETFSDLVEPERAGVLRTLKEISLGLPEENDKGDLVPTISPRDRTAAAKAFLEATKPVTPHLTANQTNISFDGKALAAMMQKSVDVRRKAEKVRPPKAKKGK